MRGAQDVKAAAGFDPSLPDAETWRVGGPNAAADHRGGHTAAHERGALGGIDECGRRRGRRNTGDAVTPLSLEGRPLPGLHDALALAPSATRPGPMADDP